VAYQFSKGPVSTGKSIQQIGAVVNEVGQERRFMGILRRMGTGSLSAAEYGPFAPQASDDPFASAGRPADWSVGWRWAHSVTNSMNMTLNQGYQVIFDVFDEQGTRSVNAKVNGFGQRKEVERFVQHVFDQL
jgi:hypothetical protein